MDELDIEAISNKSRQIYSASRYKKAYFVLAAAVVLISIRLWSFQLIPDTVYDISEVVIIAIMLGIFLVNFKKIIAIKAPFVANAWLLLLLPFVSAVGAYYFHFQSIQYSFLILRTNIFWMLYLFLHLYNVPAEKIVKLLVAVGLVWVFLTVAQQFTYPRIIFYTRSEDSGKSIERAGVYRFSVLRYNFGMFAGFYFFARYFQTKKLINIALVLFTLVGFYYYGTRQFALALVACLAIYAIVMQTGMTRFYGLILIAILGGVAIYFSDVLFSKFVKMTQDQFSGHTDDIRVRSARFYLLEYWPNVAAPLIGNGIEHSLSTYGAEMTKITQGKHFYRSDVGVIGTFSKFGIIYVINLFVLNLKGLRNKYYTEDTKYLKLIFLSTLMLIVISEYYSTSSAIPFFCCFLYLVDKSYELKNSHIIQLRYTSV